MLYGIEPSDPLMLAGAGLAMLAVAAAATLVPAWRAARTDPVAALRLD
jgi:ABC-type lipoprotein release transport system permease subunit